MTESDKAAPVHAAADTGEHVVKLSESTIIDQNGKRSSARLVVDGKPADNLDALPPGMRARVLQALNGDSLDGDGTTTNVNKYYYIEPERKPARWPLGYILAGIVLIVAVLALSQLVS